MHSLGVVGAGPVVDALRMRDLLRGVVDWRGKVARMLASGERVSLRRGREATRRDLEPRCWAGVIYGPSYVSFETALAWHGLIPEGVAEVVSATVKRGVQFENAFGRFRYIRVPAGVYTVGVLRVTESDIPFLLASPTKALCDRIAREPGFRSVADVGRWLGEMRIDAGIQFDGSELDECAARYRRPAVRWLRRFVEKHGRVTR
jgi:hypothetical protein